MKTLLNRWRALGHETEAHARCRDAIGDTLKALPVPREQADFLTPAQLAGRLKAAADHDAQTLAETRLEHAGLRPVGSAQHYVAIAPLTVFIALTGCRRDEALGLKWSDVDLDATDHEGRRVG